MKKISVILAMPIILVYRLIHLIIFLLSSNFKLWTILLPDYSGEKKRFFGSKKICFFSLPIIWDEQVPKETEENYFCFDSKNHLAGKLGSDILLFFI